MAIPIEKARKVLKEYRENNYNASKALIKAGYSESMATKQSKVTLNSAVKRVIEHDMSEIVNSSNPKDKLLQFVGMTAEDVSNEYLYIIKQNKDLTNKLKALQPLLATQGIKWNEEQTNISPTLNLTVKSNGDQKLDNIIDTTANVVAQSIEAHNLDTNNMAKQSHETDNVAQYTSLTNDVEPLNDVNDEHGGQDGEGQEKEGASGVGGVDVSLVGVKEGESPTSKFSENSAIDPSTLS